MQLVNWEMRQRWSKKTSHINAHEHKNKRTKGWMTS